MDIPKKNLNDQISEILGYQEILILISLIFQNTNTDINDVTSTNDDIF